MIIRVSILSILSFFAVIYSAEKSIAQSMAGLRIGDKFSMAVSKIGRQPDISNRAGSLKIFMWRLSDKNELHLTLSNEDKIIYMETDWNDDGGAERSDFSAFKFGQTTLIDVVDKFGSLGVIFGKRPFMSQMPGGLAWAASYGIANTGSFASFVTLVEKRDIAAAMKDGSDEDTTMMALRKTARLRAIIIADSSYVGAMWGSATPIDSAYMPIKWQ